MIFVITKERVEIDDKGYRWTWLPPEDPQHYKAKDIYVSTHHFAFSLREKMMELNIHGVPLPEPVTPEFIENPPNDKKIRMLAINGVGSGIGDCIGGMPGYARLYEEFRKRGRHLEIDVLAQDGSWPYAHQLYMFAPYMNAIIPDAMPLHDFAYYHCYTDTEDYVVDPPFATMHMYDYMCTRMSVDPTGPHRPVLGICQSAHDEMKAVVDQLPRPLMIFNPFASAIRMIPKFKWRSLVKGYVKRGWEVCLVSSKDFAKDAKWMLGVDHKTRKHVHDLTEPVSRSLHHLIALAEMVDFVVTPDTGLSHICGLTGTPTVAVFYSIDPALRMRDFTNVNSFCPPLFREGPHWGWHKPVLGTYTRANEEEFLEKMVRYANPDRVPEWHATWEKLNVEEILETQPGERIESTVHLCPMRPTEEVSDGEGGAKADTEIPSGRSAQVPEAGAGVACQADASPLGVHGG